VMDAFVIRTYWGVFDKLALRILLPGALIGIALGYASAEVMNEDLMRLLIGVISLAFGLQTLLRFSGSRGRGHNALVGGLFGTVSGFTSFSIHAGGPPFTMYLMPKGLPPLLYAGTAGMFFAVVNLVKLGPYYLLGQLAFDNLLLSLVLVPLAPLGVAAGHWLVKRSNPRTYYGVISFFLVVLGVVLIREGAAALT